MPYSTSSRAQQLGVWVRVEPKAHVVAKTSSNPLGHAANERRQFIDSSKQSLKCILLCTAKAYAGVPIGHSVILKRGHWTMQMALQKMCNDECKRAISVNLKMVNVLLGQQS